MGRPGYPKNMHLHSSRTTPRRDQRFHEGTALPAASLHTNGVLGYDQGSLRSMWNRLLAGCAKNRQRRSRIAQRLNVRPRVRFAPSLVAALMDSFFAHPAWLFNIVSHLNIRDGDTGQNEFFCSLLEHLSHDSQWSNPWRFRYRLCGDYSEPS